MKESSKNIIIFFLFIIFVGLIYLLYYAYNYQKKLESEVPTTNEVTKSLNFKLNNKSIKIDLKEKKTTLEIYFNDKRIDSIENGTISQDNIIDVVTYEESDYLLVSIPVNKYYLFILNDEGKIIYEFNDFDYGDYTKFIDDQNNKNIFIDNKQIYIYQRLNEEDKATYSELEYARKHLVKITSEEVTFEFIEITHGTYK